MKEISFHFVLVIATIYPNYFKTGRGFQKFSAKTEIIQQFIPEYVLELVYYASQGCNNSLATIISNDKEISDCFNSYFVNITDTLRLNEPQSIDKFIPLNDPVLNTEKISEPS